MTRNEKLGLLADHIEQKVKDDDYNHMCWSGCAAGLATQIPQFKELGYGRSIDSKGEFCEPTFNGYYAGSAVIKFFEISRNEYDQSFRSGNCFSRLEAVAALRKLLK